MEGKLSSLKRESPDTSSPPALIICDRFTAYDIFQVRLDESTALVSARIIPLNRLILSCRYLIV